MRNKKYKCAEGFTLIEMLAVIGLIALMAGGTMVSFSAMWGNMKFKSQARELVNTLQMARDAASTSDRRYEILLDLTEQSYILREFIAFELLIDDTFDEDTIIQQRFFSEALTIDYILFDDSVQSEDSIAVAPEDAETKTVVRFLAGKSGWQAGGKVVLLDEDGMPWTILIPRFAAPVELVKGDVEILLPQLRESVPF